MGNWSCWKYWWWGVVRCVYLNTDVFKYTLQLIQFKLLQFPWWGGHWCSWWPQFSRSIRVVWQQRSLPECSRLNRPFIGWWGSLMILQALVLHLLVYKRYSTISIWIRYIYCTINIFKYINVINNIKIYFFQFDIYF